MELTLKIFITQSCPTCTETYTIARQIRQNYPDLTVELVDITDQQAVVPESIFATPTFMLNNRVVSLGNPSVADVAGWVNQAIQQPA